MQTLNRPAALCLVVAGMLAGAGRAEGQALTLQFRDGLVTLNATQVPVSRILDLWARTGGATIINGDKVGGLPVTLSMVDAPERAVLEVLLRGVGGYVLAESRAGAGGLARIGRILIVPPSAAPAAALSGAAPRAAAARPASPDQGQEPDVETPEGPSAVAEAVTAGPESPARPPVRLEDMWRTPTEPTTASRPGEIIAAPRPPGTPPTPNAANRRFDTSQGPEAFQRQIEANRQADARESR